MRNLYLRMVLATLVLAACAATSAFAQGGGATSSITGVVVDSGGGVIPGATITATNDATAGKYVAVSSGNGTFTIPALNVGSYTVTVSLQGFKSAILKNIAVSAGTAATIRAVLEVGGVTETVVVEGGTEVVQTQASATATTLTTNQLMSLPSGSRSVLDYVTFLPGVLTASGSRDSIVNGLPQSSINMTLDGVSVQDNWLKTTDGFFARVSPRLDAIEEVTVTTAASGAEASGMGSTQIRFTTRSGSNSLVGSSYYYYQDKFLNSNTYFNKLRGLAKNDALLKQPGTRAGGPVVIPGLYDGRGKMFFFANYEESRSPRTRTTVSNFMTDEAQSGLFRYETSGGAVQSVNLYALAAQNGHLASPDPTVAALLGAIKAAVATGGTIEDLAGNYTAKRFSFRDKTSSITYYPTIRIDHNLTGSQRLSGSWNFTNLASRPDTTNTQQRTFPGFPLWGSQLSKRYTFQATLRSTLNPNLINEVRFGASGGATQFSPDKNPDMWTNQGGYALGISAAGVANAGSGAGVSAREGSTKFVENNLSWLKGAHAVTMGGQYTHAEYWFLQRTHVPSLDFGLVTGDPAIGMFSSANFPGSSTTQRNAAQALYAVLTGRISQVGGNVRLNKDTLKYVYNGDSFEEGRLPELDLFLQDNWKVRPNLSVNVGLRYVAQLPFFAKNGSYSTVTLDDVWGISGNLPGCNPSQPTSATCNLFKSGTTPGSVPTYKNLPKNTSTYNTDWDNIAPSIGVNWTPRAESGFLRRILGDAGDTSFSGGWSRAYERHGMSDFRGVLSANPGVSVTGNRNLSNGNLGTVPLLLRSGYLGPPAVCSGGAAPPACFPEAPSYPIAATTTGSVNMFDPNLQVPYSDSWTAGYQRAIGRRSAFEIRYIGTRNRDQWTTYNVNEANILDNGFYQEFLNAQANLYANIAAGRGQTFAFFGPGTGTSPLPVYLAYFTGTPLSQASDASRYTGSNWSNSNFVNPLNRLAPNPFTPTGTNANTGLQGNATFRSNALAAGLPRNYFYANPDALGGANVTGHGGYTRYHGVQMQFRRRLSGGLQFDVNYATGKAEESVRYSFRVDRKLRRDAGGEGDVPHSFKSQATYELPFGQGKRFGGSVGPVVDRIIGGWQVSGALRLQSGQLFDLGNVRVVGMSLDEARKAFKFRQLAPDVMYMWPDDIIENTRRAYARDINGYTLGAPTGRYFAPASGIDCIETISNDYGDCGQRTFVIQGPMIRSFDLNFVKAIRLSGRRSVDFRLDALNVLDIVNFDPETGVSQTTLANWQIDSADSGRVVQLVIRVNW
jgi:hypothetical protein